MHILFATTAFFDYWSKLARGNSVCLELVTRLRDECVVLESDILWGTIPEDPEKGYQEYLQSVVEGAQRMLAGREACGIVWDALPEQYEICPERRYFSTIHYLALVCENWAPGGAS